MELILKLKILMFHEENLETALLLQQKDTLFNQQKTTFYGYIYCLIVTIIIIVAITKVTSTIYTMLFK